MKVTPEIDSVDVPVSSKVRFEGIAVQQVDAVERGVLRRGVDLLQDLVVLRDQAGAGRLRVRIGDRSSRGQAGESRRCRAVPPIVPIVDEAASLVVVMVIAPVVSMLACRLFAANAVLSSLSVETWPLPVPKVMLVAVPPPVAPIVQRLAGERGGSDVRSFPRLRPSAASALPVPPRDDQVLCRTRAEHELAGTVDRRGRGGAGDRRRSRLRTVCTVAVLPAPVPIVTLPLPSVVVVVCAGAEGDGLAVDGQNRSGGDGGREVVGGAARGADQLGRSRDIDRRCVVVLDGRAGDGGVGPGPSRLFAVAPVMAVVVTLDFVE